MWREQRAVKGTSAAYAYAGLQKLPFLTRTLGIYGPPADNDGDAEDKNNRKRKKTDEEDQEGPGENNELAFEIVYLDDTAEPRFRLEHRTNYRCPFCSHLENAEGALMKHLKRFHQDHHVCQQARKKNGLVTTITCTPTRAYYNQAVKEAMEFKKDQMFRYGLYEDFQFFRFRVKGDAKKRKRRKIKPWIPPGWNSRHPPASLEEPWTSGVKANFSKHTPPSASRQYYHSPSRLPMRLGDWNVDSDDESDDEWIDQWGQGGLHEFIDVDDKEKQILDMWNRYIRSDCVIADRDVPSKALSFIKKYAGELLHAREKLLMLLTLFCEQRAIPADHIVTCMETYDSLCQEILAARSSAKVKTEGEAES